ncbi:MAG: Uma2 family endonuclease [Polyangiaceae bacterium]|nr:Uma2 family endonuclease [Polyangiaceae bacterium]
MARVSEKRVSAPGPFRADQIPEGAPYELSNGHPVLCLPTGRRGGLSNLIGGEVLETDPAVKAAGVDVGFSKDPTHLRAPDVSVGDFANEPGWAPDAPPLAVEYADTGQDESELQRKIEELLAAGTRFVWVVRLVGPRRVEVHEKGRAMRLAQPGEELRAPGILQNAVPVLALFDREAAHEATLRNLLQRRGYDSLDAVRAAGKRDALLRLLARAGIALTDEERTRIEACEDGSTLDRWVENVLGAKTAADVLS